MVGVAVVGVAVEREVGPEAVGQVVEVRMVVEGEVGSEAGGVDSQVDVGVHELPSRRRGKRLHSRYY
eukprot:COSAG01_NODE_10896_length_2056_cov_3.102197_2_plen_67_part_00